VRGKLRNGSDLSPGRHRFLSSKPVVVQYTSRNSSSVSESALPPLGKMVQLTVLLQAPQWFRSVAMSVHSPVQHAGVSPKQGVALQAPQ
jgi:hypothetical protein